MLAKFERIGALSYYEAGYFGLDNIQVFKLESKTTKTTTTIKTTSTGRNKKKLKLKFNYNFYLNLKINKNH